jgi:nanoRNase/pAp phosphatase (c-di-AMP/oligoRNAs hydrolase)
MLTFQYDGKAWQCSIYTTKNDIDCSVIAKSLGGGGHAGAAGFTTDAIFKLIKVKK